MNTILIALRKSKNWDLGDIAEELEIDVEAYKKIEEGDTPITIDNAIRLGKLYEIEPEIFFSSTSKITNNNIGTYSKGVVNTVNYYEKKED